jgi:periplasmic divalent cation tolerance protein
MNQKFIVVLVTTSGKEEAEKIARQLLDEKLIACANIISSVSSLFRWSGKIESAEEYIVLMKTRLDLFEKLEKTIKLVHSYQVPEIIALPIIKGSKQYMEWLDTCF